LMVMRSTVYVLGWPHQSIWLVNALEKGDHSSL